MKKLLKTILAVMTVTSALVLVTVISAGGQSQTIEGATYTFTDTVRKVGTTKITINGTETEYDIVEFGDWPQTIKASSVTVDEPDF